ncbi:MAG: hypothetical protein HLUCCX14_09660 [Marinobacter excellens HL-55]|uniref:Lipoprotein n=1 Tax=Marinobacter excellens HL-55 TaxID=1305731 RepID=A0A0P7YE44_9GAMM|nr:MAG: hypothetical protein HLUCCX14_09660 [Marinobacter excellens HL-55]
MNTKKNLLGLAVLTTSLALVGCGGSSSSGNQQTDGDTTSDEPTFPAVFAFSQDPAAALNEMKDIPDKALPPELYELIREQFIDGTDSSGQTRLELLTGLDDFTNIQCGANFGDDANPADAADGKPANSFQTTITDPENEAELGAYSDGSGNTAALFNESFLLDFNDCQLVDPDNTSIVVATIDGEVSFIREWVGESSNSSMGRDRVLMENFYFNFGPNGNEETAPVEIAMMNGTTYGLAFNFTETHVFGEFSQSQKNALGNFEYAETFRTRLFIQRLVDNDFNGMYAFDTSNLKIVTTPNGGTPAQVKFNNFASVLSLKPDPSDPGLFDYELAVEANYRGDENSDSTSIVFGTGESEQSLFLETRKHGSTDGLIAGTADISSLKGLLRDRSANVEEFSCPDGSSLGYSATSEAPLVAGLVFLDNTNDENTLRVFVDGDNEQTSRDPSVAISTMSFDADCSPGNGPTHFIPLPGLGGVEYTTTSQPPQV